MVVSYVTNKSVFDCTLQNDVTQCTPKLSYNIKNNNEKNNCTLHFPIPKRSTYKIDDDIYYLPLASIKHSKKTNHHLR